MQLGTAEFSEASAPRPDGSKHVGMEIPYALQTQLGTAEFSVASAFGLDAGGMEIRPNENHTLSRAIQLGTAEFSWLDRKGRKAGRRWKTGGMIGR